MPHLSVGQLVLFRVSSATPTPSGGLRGVIPLSRLWNTWTWIVEVSTCFLPSPPIPTPKRRGVWQYDFIIAERYMQPAQQLQEIRLLRSFVVVKHFQKSENESHNQVPNWVSPEGHRTDAWENLIQNGLSMPDTYSRSGAVSLAETPAKNIHPCCGPIWELSPSASITQQHWMGEVW